MTHLNRVQTCIRYNILLNLKLFETLGIGSVENTLDAKREVELEFIDRMSLDVEPSKPNEVERSVTLYGTFK